MKSKIVFPSHLLYLLYLSSLCHFIARSLSLTFSLFVQLPQQQNSFDCGLFLLHYAELFLEEAPLNFNPFKITKLSKFVSELLCSLLNLSNLLIFIFVNAQAHYLDLIAVSSQFKNTYFTSTLV